MNQSRVSPILVTLGLLIALAAGLGAGLWLLGDDDSPTATGSSDADGAASPTTEGADQPPDNPSAPTTTSESTTTTTTTTTLPPGHEELATLVATMSMEDKARQLIVVGVAGSDTDGVARSVGSSCLGGVFVARNWTPVGSATAARAVIADIDDAATEEQCVGPPLVMTDAEPGTRVLKVPVTAIPSAPDLHRRYVDGDAEGALEVLAEEGGRFAGEIAGLGVHVNLGAIADVDVGAEYFMARQGRSFGGDADAVAALNRAFVEAHCASGLAATLKHFPNQGATIEDPHGEPSFSDDSEAEWESRGRVPYVDTRAPLVMTGHIFLDTDPERPASLSRPITTGLLRDGLDFQGVVITDDLAGMVGVTGLVAEPENRAVEAIAAGADLALFVDSGGHAVVIDAIVERAERDADFAAQVDISVARVLRLKAGLGLIDGLDSDWFPLCDSTTTPFVLPPIPPAPVVAVGNTTDRPGLASRTAELLADLDVDTVLGNATPGVDATTVYYAPDHRELADAVATALDIETVRVESAPTDVGARFDFDGAATAVIWVAVGLDAD